MEGHTTVLRTEVRENDHFLSVKLAMINSLQNTIFPMMQRNWSDWVRRVLLENHA